MNNIQNNNEIQDIIIKKLSYLLKYKLKKYTINSTLSIEEANKINESNIYIINNYLKNKDKINILLNEDIINLYNESKKELDIKVSKTKLFYKTIFKNNLLKLDNYFYTETLNSGIEYLFKLYNTSYDATNYIITVDYNPLLNRPNEKGINFIYEYLNYINYENVFLKNFNINKVNKLIGSYKDIPINILELVLETVILLKYQNIDIYTLDKQLLNISSIYYDHEINKENYINKLNKSYLIIKKELNINNNYIDKCSDIVIKNIIYKTKHKTLINNNKEIFYKPNDRLTNLINDNQTENEILSILKKLNIIEIMILKNNYIFNDYIDNILTKYIKTLNKKEQYIINNNYMNLRIIE